MIGEHWKAPAETAGAKPLTTYDSEEVAKGMQQLRSGVRRLARVELQEDAQRFPQHGLILDDSILLAEIVECVDELRGSEEPLNRELASRLLEILQDVGVVEKPPMIAVVEPIRDSFCLGGVGYGV